MVLHRPVETTRVIGKLLPTSRHLITNRQIAADELASWFHALVQLRFTFKLGGCFITDSLMSWRFFSQRIFQVVAHFTFPRILHHLIFPVRLVG